MKYGFIFFVLAFSAELYSAPFNLFGTSYAVVIGIDKYPNYKGADLPFGSKDAKAMSAFFKRKGFVVKEFIGTSATKPAILSYLEDELSRSITANDRVVFYFSGHGETISRANTDFGYIIPYDASDKSSSWISMEDIHRLSKLMDAARHQLFIFDSCFSGLFDTKSSLSTYTYSPNYISRVSSNRARQYITAGGKNEKVPASGKHGYSYFTGYLLEALEGKANAYPDGFVTFYELASWLGAAAANQYSTPRADTLPGHEQGEFIFRMDSPLVGLGAPTSSEHPISLLKSPSDNPGTLNPPSLDVPTQASNKIPDVLDDDYSLPSSSSNSSTSIFNLIGSFFKNTDTSNEHHSSTVENSDRHPSNPIPTPRTNTPPTSEILTTLAGYYSNSNIQVIHTGGDYIGYSADCSNLSGDRFAKYDNLSYGLYLLMAYYYAARYEWLGIPHSYENIIFEDENTMHFGLKDMLKDGDVELIPKYGHFVDRMSPDDKFSVRIAIDKFIEYYYKSAGLLTPELLEAIEQTSAYLVDYSQFGLPKDDNPCMRADFLIFPYYIRGLDGVQGALRFYPIEAYFYSFWARRYKEGNARIVLKVFEMARALL